MTLTEIIEEILPKLTVDDMHELASMLWEEQRREDCKPGEMVIAPDEKPAGESKRGESQALAEFKKDILPKLSMEEKLELAWELWDEELREDFKNHGPMWKLGQEAIAAHERGETEEWP